MTTIYHFTNTGPGIVFLNRYSQFPEEILKKINVKVIFSYTGGSTRFFPLRKILKRINSKKQDREYRKQFLDFPFSTSVICNVNDFTFINQIPDGSIAICSGFDQIFSADLIGCFDNFINIHPSILPYYRGPIPSYWCIKNGEKFSGFTYHRVTKKIDSGEILLQGKIEISPKDSEHTLDQKIAVASSKYLLPWITHLVNGEEWQIEKEVAEEIYSTKVDYRSFYK